MIKCCFIVCLCFLVLSAVRARNASGHPSQILSEEKDEKSVSNNFWSDASFMYKIYQQCSKEDIMICLKVKMLAGLDKAFQHSRELKLTDEIKFLNEEAEENKTKSGFKTEKDIEDSLPRSFEDKDQVLNDMILNKVTSFLQSHTLQIKFPNSKDLERSFSEGRGKGKKGKQGGVLLVIPLLLGTILIPIAYGALVFLAGKALIVSKLALVLSTIIGIKKLLSGNNKESQHEVVVSGGHGGSGWGRDFDLAYRAYDPVLKQNLKT